jgi:hypothetical protein
MSPLPVDRRHYLLHGDPPCQHDGESGSNSHVALVARSIVGWLFASTTPLSRSHQDPGGKKAKFGEEG